MSTAGLALLLLSPLVTWSGLGYDEAARPVALLGALFWMAGGRTGIRGWPDHLSTLAVAWIALSAVVATDRRESALGLVPGIVALVAFRRGPPGEALERRFRTGLGALAVAFAGIGLVQAWFEGGNAVSTLGNTNYSGILAAALAAGCAGSLRAPGPRILLAAGAVLSALLVGASGSRAAFLGLAAGAVVLAAFEARERRWVPAVAALLLAGIPLLGCPGAAARVASIGGERDHSEGVRLALWRDTASMIADRPFLGVGAGNYRAGFPPYRRTAQAGAEDPHDTALQLAAESGVVAPVLVAVLWMALLVSAWKRRAAAPAAGLVVLAVAGVFNSLSNHLPFAILAGLWGAQCLAPAEPIPGRRWPALAVLALWIAWSLPVLGADLAFAEGMRTSRPVERERAMARALDLDSRHVRARVELANAIAAQGHGATAAHHLRMALSVQPHHFGALRLLASCSPDPREAEGARRLAEELAKP